MLAGRWPKARAGAAGAVQDGVVALAALVVVVFLVGTLVVLVTLVVVRPGLDAGCRVVVPVVAVVPLVPLVVPVVLAAAAAAALVARAAVAVRVSRTRVALPRGLRISDGAVNQN